VAEREEHECFAKEAATLKASQEPAACPSSAGISWCHRLFKGLAGGSARAERASHFSITAVTIEAAGRVGILLTLDALALVLSCQALSFTIAPFDTCVLWHGRAMIVQGRHSICIASGVQLAFCR